jgi:hypothetical protein
MGKAKMDEPAKNETSTAQEKAGEQSPSWHEYRARLRQLLSTHFNTEELKTLCFDLVVDFENLPAQGKAGKARELVTYLERLGRIPELVALCCEQRPDAPWGDVPEVTPGALPGSGYSDSVGRGLSALVELMQVPEARAAVVAFDTDFGAACAQIDVLGDYKALHDLLHKLQFHCYNPIVQEARRFPDDDVAVETLMDYELTLGQIVNDLRDVVEQASFAETETLWMQDLVKAQDALGEALEKLDAKLLKRPIWHLNRVLAIQPSQINTRLNAAARALRLPALLEAMGRVSDNLARLDLDPERVGQFEAGVDALVSLNESLTALVGDHDRWQVVDLELRRIEANMEQGTMELEMSWPDLKAMTEPLYSDSAEEWAVAFRKDSDHLDDAIAAENPARIKRHFRRFSRHADARFQRVDSILKRLCEDLRKVGEPLASVMRMIK